MATHGPPAHQLSQITVPIPITQVENINVWYLFFLYLLFLPYPLLKRASYMQVIIQRPLPWCSAREESRRQTAAGCAKAASERTPRTTSTTSSVTPPSERCACACYRALSANDKGHQAFSTVITVLARALHCRRRKRHSAVGGIWFCRMVQMKFTLLAAR